jgi:hypothetical protein
MSTDTTSLAVRIARLEADWTQVAFDEQEILAVAKQQREDLDRVCAEESTAAENAVRSTETEETRKLRSAEMLAQASHKSALAEATQVRQKQISDIEHSCQVSVENAETDYHSSVIAAKTMAITEYDALLENEAARFLQKIQNLTSVFKQIDQQLADASQAAHALIITNEQDAKRAIDNLRIRAGNLEKYGSTIDAIGNRFLGHNRVQHGLTPESPRVSLDNPEAAAQYIAFAEAELQKSFLTCKGIEAEHRRRSKAIGILFIVLMITLAVGAYFFLEK